MKLLEPNQKPTKAQKRAHYKKVIEDYEKELKYMKKFKQSESRDIIGLCINLAQFYKGGYGEVPWSIFNYRLFNYYPELSKVENPSNYKNDVRGIKFRIKILNQAIELASPKPKT